MGLGNSVHLAVLVLPVPTDVVQVHGTSAPDPLE